MEEEDSNNHPKVIIVRNVEMRNEVVGDIAPHNGWMTEEEHGGASFAIQADSQPAVRHPLSYV